MILGTSVLMYKVQVHDQQAVHIVNVLRYSNSAVHPIW